MSTKMFSDIKPSSNTKMFGTVKNDPLSNPKPVNQTSNQKSQPTTINQNNNKPIPQEPEKDVPECILIMGDVHIPNRIDSLPPEITNILEENKNKFNRIICTGNFGNMENYNYFKSLLGKDYQFNFNCVKNDFQDTSLSFPETLTIKSNEYKIGVINGYQIVPWGDLTTLSSYSKKLECDILISGFTHIRGVYNFEGKYFINPGTITGAFSSLSNNPPPSFMILITVNDSATLYQYELNQNTKSFDVSKIELNKS